jgi:aminocarboxymuconate-semialdehyde decarboxylase
MSRLYYDTILNEPRALRALIDLVGSDRVIVGTDYPYALGDRDPVRSVMSIPGADDETRELVLSGNMRRLIDEVRR